MLKKCISFLLAAIFTLVSPLQILGSVEDRYWRGKNPYQMHGAAMLDESEMDALVAALQAKNAAKAAQPSVSAVQNTSQSLAAVYAPGDTNPPLVQNADDPTAGMFRLYPIVEKAGGKSVFRGVFVSGNIAADNEIGDFEALTYTLNDAASSAGSVSPPLGGYVYPNSAALGYGAWVQGGGDGFHQS